MGILLGFAPFIVFALLMNVAVDLALWAAFATAFVLSIRDFAHTRILRTLDVGSTALFGLLAFYAGFVHPSISPQAVRFIVDCGLLLIAVYSMASGNPLTGGVTEMALFAQAPPIYGGTDQVQRNIIGERALGLPKEPNNDRTTPFSQLPKNA